MPDLSRESQRWNRDQPGQPSTLADENQHLRDALDAAEQRAKGAALESDERAEKWRAAEQRAEKAERDLALEMDSRGRWAARAEDAEQRAEKAEAALRSFSESDSWADLEAMRERAEKAEAEVEALKIEREVDLREIRSLAAEADSYKADAERLAEALTFAPTPEFAHDNPKVYEHWHDGRRRDALAQHERERA